MSRHHVALKMARWSRARRQVFKRDRYRCVLCGKAGRLECDHVRPLAKGGAPYDPENLRTLCRDCHIQATAKGNRRPLGAKAAAWQALAAEPV